ncbi:MAG: proton-conducting transporter membrane subunit [Hymenobacter sp.]
METVLPGANAPYPTFLYVLIPLLPFLGFLLNGLLNRKLSGTVAGLIGSATVLGSFLISVMLFLNFQYQYTVRAVRLDFGGLAANSFQYQIDQLSLIMLLLVTGVGFLIHVYSIGYMHHDENVGKFFSFLNLFIFSMLLLVMGANFVILFIGWEGVGLCSYLLIGFWNKNTAYNNAAKKAFIINRIGDLGFLLGIFLIYLTFNSVQYAEVFQKASTDAVWARTAWACARPSRCCCLWAPWASRPSCRSTPGCPTPWPAPRRCRPYPRRYHGHGRHLHGAAGQRAVHAGARYAGGSGHCGRGHGVVCRHHRPGAERHQESAGLLHGVAARLHVPGLGRDGVQRLAVPRPHPRVFQGADVPRGRLRDSRHEQRAGPAPHGRPAQGACPSPSSRS